MRTRLPAAPLLAAVDATVGRPQPGWTTRLRRRVGESGVRAYERAQQDGSLTLRRVERFCDRFGWHPRELYGDAYDAAALAGCPADFDPWAGVA
jgi:hypothetical protein